MSKALTFFLPIEALKQVVRRFPLSVLSSLLLFGLALYQIHNDLTPGFDRDFMWRAQAWLGCGFFWFGIVDLLAESRGWKNAKKFAVRIPVFAGLLGLIFWLGEGELEFFLRSIGIALVLGVSAAPFFMSRDNLSFWFFNYKLWFGVAASIAAGIIWLLGICASLAALDYLFGLKLDIYGDVWAFACIVFTPLYTLTWVPERFSFTEEECNAPPQLGFLMNGILIPLLMLYGIILYAYFGKILIMQGMPRGQLVYMIAGFGIVGIITYLSGWQMRSKTAITRFFYKIFFPALIIPAVMQSFAISLRINQYGITEDRYLVTVCSVWFLIIAIAFTLMQARKIEGQIKMIPIVLIILTVLSSAGPWGAFALSTNTQYARLETMLTANNILQNGKIVPTTEDVPFATRKEISGVVEYLTRGKKTGKLKEWFGTDWPSVEGNEPYAEGILNKMGIRYVNGYVQEENGETVYLNAQQNGNRKFFEVRGYDYALTDHNYMPGTEGKNEWPADEAPGLPAIVVTLNKNIMHVQVGVDAFTMDLGPLVTRELEDVGGAHDNMVIEADSSDAKVKVHFENLTVRRKDGQAEVTSVQYLLFIKTGLETP